MADMPLMGSAVKSAGRRHATRASSSSALPRPPAIDPTSPEHPAAPPSSSSSSSCSSCSFLGITLAVRASSLPTTPATGSSAHGAAQGWTVCGWRVTRRLVATLALLSLASKLCGFLLLTYLVAWTRSSHTAAAGLASGTAGSVVAAGSEGGSGAGAGEVARLASEFSVPSAASLESREQLPLDAYGVCSPPWRDRVRRHFGRGGRGAGEGLDEGKRNGAKGGGGERGGGERWGEPGGAHGRRLGAEGRGEEADEEGRGVEAMVGRLCDEGLPMAAALFGVNHSADASVQLACGDASSSSFPSSSPSSSLPPAPLAFLYVAAVPEQLSKARAHLVEVAALARRFNRTLIVPRVGHSRVDFRRHLPFCAYFDGAMLQRCGVHWVTEDWFIAFVRRGRLAVRPTYICLVPGVNDTCASALNTSSAAFLSVLAIAQHPPSPANSLALRSAYHTRRERWGAQMEREEAGLLGALERAGKGGVEGGGAEGEGRALEEGQGEGTVAGAQGSGSGGGDSGDGKSSVGSGGAAAVDVVVVGQSSWFFTLRESSRAQAAACLDFSPGLQRAAQRFAERMRAAGGAEDGGSREGLLDVAGSRARESGSERAARGEGAAEGSGAAGVGSAWAVHGEGSEARQGRLAESVGEESAWREGGLVSAGGRYAAVHLRLEFITFKASKGWRRGTAPIQAVRSWLMGCAGSAVSATRRHLERLNSTAVFLAADVTPSSPPTSSPSSPSQPLPSQPNPPLVRLQSDSWPHEGEAGAQLLAYVSEAYWHVRRELGAVVWEEQEPEVKRLDRGMRGVLDKLACAEADVFVMGDDACGGMQNFDLDVCAARKALNKPDSSTVHFSRGRI
ncbi:hypothetical protein CLOM_g22213 [Closterium sp. NIES-68]|nr:hypothetical protein CLOM_g22213 [Closterium sp. NIES-68]GJP79149.1 hypothetical protein CLOP_g9394 [Closterium sp. NIES-67]